MSGMTTALRRLREGEAGIGLAELVVAISLLAVLMTVVVSLVVAMTRAYTREELSTDSANVASVAMKELSRVIRAGTEIQKSGSSVNYPALAYADSNSLTIYAFLDTSATSPAPVKVQFTVDATTRELRETRWTIKKNAAGTYWDLVSTPTKQWDRTIAQKSLAPGTSLPDGSTATNLFVYLDKDSNPIAVPGGGLSEDDRRRVAAIQVTLTIQSDPTNRAQPVKMQNSVGIPNLGISRVGPPPS